MARPKTPRICEANITDIDTVQVVNAAQQWAVTYKNQLISVVRTRLGTNNPKYLRTNYVTYAPAWNMAQKLNNLFDSTDFDVREIQ